MIDSIEVLYPKSFDQIKDGMDLLQEIRLSQNQQQIQFCDSVISIMEPKIDSLKAYFIYDIDKEYQETGRYLPKGQSSKTLLGSTMLRSGVAENGILFIESVYVGGTKYHDRIKISTKDGFFAETLPVISEGLNFRFTDSGKQYEVIKFTGTDENGIAKFIKMYAEKPLTVTLSGKNTTSFALSNTSKKEIIESYQLSTWILELDSIKSVKEKSEYLIDHLQRKIKPAEIVE